MVRADGEDRALTALQKRIEGALAVVRKGRVLEELSRLAETRAQLDAVREDALQLIFDEDVYFYPYSPPEPPNTPGQYARAQRIVNERVKDVTDVWKNASRRVELAGSFRAAVEEVQWGLEALYDAGVEGELPESVPAFVLALPLDVEEVGLAQFAWTLKERRELDHSRRVRELNDRRFEEVQGGIPGFTRNAIPEKAERDQVRITNDYRVMMGRRALAWNPRIQVAAQGHSNYMADTGDFGHTEKDPERHTVLDRMRLVDYRGGAGENCAQNGGDPRGAHDGWLQSSGHHRNILQPQHREMASAVAGFYWTQNFGAGDEDLEHLDA
jgi:uncharacterized protein YkwD